jgi:hypothetical protein
MSMVSIDSDSTAGLDSPNKIGFVASAASTIQKYFTKEVVREE